MIDIKKAIKSIHTIIRYCKEQDECKKCTFFIGRCPFEAPSPDYWDEESLKKSALEQRLKNIFDEADYNATYEIIASITDEVAEIYGED